METNETGKGMCKVRKIIVGGSVINPLLLNIDNRPLTREEIDGSECSWYDSVKDKTARVVKFVNHEGAVYEGTGKINRKMCRTMLVLQNKKTNKIKLVEVSECQLGRVLPKSNLRTNYHNDEIKTTYKENQANLHKAFGSKKSKRFSDIGSKMQINSNITKTQMIHTAAGVVVDVKELESVDNAVDDCMPPCHRDATDPHEVFLLEDFLTPRELDSMTDEAFTIFHLMPFTEKESGYSKFFIDTLERLQYKATEERIKILLYIESLMKFLRLNLQNKKKKELIEEISPFSPVLARKILDNFSIDTVNGRVRSITMDDKIVIHVMILVLIVCDNSCNIDELSKYLSKFSVPKLRQMARALSLSSKDKNTWFIKLPLPPFKAKYLRKKKK